MGRNPRDDDYPRSDGSKRPKPFEIEGDWGDKGELVAPKELRLDTSLPPRNEPDSPLLATRTQVPSQASLEERVEHLEKMMQLTWKVVHDLEGKGGKGGKEGE